MSDEKEYTDKEINNLLLKFNKEYSDELKNGFKNIQCKVKQENGINKYYYIFDGNPVHKKVALKILKKINPKQKKAYKNVKFKNNKFN